MALFKQRGNRLLVCVTLILTLVATFGLVWGPVVALAEDDESTTTVIDFEPTGSEESPISNNPTRLNVTKYDMETDEALKGAKLAIYEVEDGETKDEVVSWTSDEDAEVIEGLLSIDKIYLLRELEAPQGYDKVKDTYFVLRSENYSTKGYITNKDGVQVAEKDIPDYVRVEDMSGSGNSQAFIINLYDSEGGDAADDEDSDEGEERNSPTASRATALAERLAKTYDSTSMTLIATIATCGAVMLAIGLHRIRTRV